MENFDIGIVGGGPAGYTAAFKAREKGLSVVLFEEKEIGGVCLNKGCIPTKAILHCAELYEEIKCFNDSGILENNFKINYSKVVERKDEIIKKLRKNLELALKNAKIRVVNHHAIIQDSKILAGEEIFSCGKIITATGSKPKDFPNIRIDNKFVLSSDDVLNLKILPKNILIVGSGAIGIEWARIFSAFEVNVSIVETAEHLLPTADIEISKRIERIFKSKNIKMYLSNSVEKIENREIILKSGEKITPECVLLAVGRQPIKISETEQCIGDACGEIQLAHFAIKQAIELVLGIEFNHNLVPAVVYGSPEIAWVGKREQDLAGLEYQKSMILLSSLGKSHCDNSTDGFIKILSRNNKIIGAHIISKEASSLIQQIAIAMQNNIAIDDLKKVCFAHPTYSEGIFESLFRFK